MAQHIVIEVTPVHERQYQLSVGELHYGQFLMKGDALSRGDFLYDVLLDLIAEGKIPKDTVVEYKNKSVGVGTTQTR